MQVGYAVKAQGAAPGLGAHPHAAQWGPGLLLSLWKRLAPRSLLVISGSRLSQRWMLGDHSLVISLPSENACNGTKT